MQLRIQRILKVSRRGEDQTSHAARIEHRVMVVVRQPHQPGPSLRVAGDDHNLDVGGTVINRKRTHNRPHQPAQFIDVVSDETEAGLGTHAHYLADIADLALLDDEIP